MYFQIDFEKRKVLIQDIIDRLTRLDATKGAEYLKSLEGLNKEYKIDLDTDALGVRYYPTNQNLK
jgi:hypothetical protein